MFTTESLTRKQTFDLHWLYEDNWIYSKPVEFLDCKTGISSTFLQQGSAIVASKDTNRWFAYGSSIPVNKNTVPRYTNAVKKYYA